MMVNQDMRAHWAMSSIYYIVRVFGLAPYFIVVDESKTYWKVTKLSVLYNIIITLFISIFSVPALWFHKTYLVYLSANNIRKNTDLFRRGGSITYCISCLLLSFINRHKICKMMDDINEFDRNIGCIGITLNYKRIHRNNSACTILFYLMFMMTFTIDLVDLIQTVDSLFYMYWIYFLLIVIANFSTVIQFVGFVHMISTRFVALNMFTTKLFEPSFEKRLIKTNAWTAKHGHKITLGSLAKTKIIYSKQNYVNMMCAMHYTLCDMGKELNAMYSIQIMLCIGISFLDLLIRLYRFYLILMSNDISELTIIQALNRITLAIIFSQMIIMLSLFCSKFKKEANSCSILLHQTNFEDDDETKASIVMFYLQMFHQKFEFSAGGFFPVDSSVLYMVVGTITTYLVILIQFQMAASQ